MLIPKENSPITYFAETDSRGKRVPFGIKARDRSRHMYTIGKTGMGKSTMLENMAIQDIKNGNGLCFIDPHGKTADLLLDYIPEERIKDTLYFAPFDMEHPVSFNIMEDVGADKRHLVVNGLMATFEKIWVDAWSARMAYILQNTLLALLEYPGSTLLGVNRMLVDKEYRRQVVENITDPSVRAFWIDEFAKYTDRYTQEATPAIQNKVGQFTANPLIRNIVGQSKSTFDLRRMMDEKKIVIMNLSKGKVGEGNANLLGSMLITKIYLAAMSRADVTERELQKLPDFYLYVDEFQSFANKSFADILSEARKYKLNLTLAHQYIEQMEEEVSAAVFGNVGTMIVFRVGAFDAEVLEKEFAPAITAEDLVNLGIYQVYLKLMIDGVTSPPFSAVTLAPLPPPSVSFRDNILAYSRSTFGRSRIAVEEEIKKWHAPVVHVPIRKEPVHTGTTVDSQHAKHISLPTHHAESGHEYHGHRESGKEHQTMEHISHPHHVPSNEQNPRHGSVEASGGIPTAHLSELRHEHNKQTHGKPFHIGELRKALAEVLNAEHSRGGNEHKDTVSKAASAPQGANQTPSAGAWSGKTGNDSAGPKEIPESLLRQLLSVKEENTKKSETQGSPKPQ